jgi:Flp pilus assembly protein CpaB
MVTIFRNRNLSLAAALGLAAAILTMLYVSRAQGSTKAPVVSSQPVLVATRDLPVGTSFSAAFAGGAIALRHLPAESVAPSALTGARAVDGRVVIQPIFKGEQVTAARLGPSAAQGLGANLHGSLRAIALAGDATQLLGSSLKPGDHVDVVVNVKGLASARTRIALKDLLVLQAPTTSGSSGGLMTTLQLTDKQVQALFWITRNGDWSLVLRPPAKAAVTAIRPTTQSDVLAARS